MVRIASTKSGLISSEVFNRLKYSTCGCIHVHMHKVFNNGISEFFAVPHFWYAMLMYCSSKLRFSYYVHVSVYNLFTCYFIIKYITVLCNIVG